MNRLPDEVEAMTPRLEFFQTCFDGQILNAHPATTRFAWFSIAKPK